MISPGKARGDSTSAAYQAYVSMGESRATLPGDIRRSFSTAC